MTQASAQIGAAVIDSLQGSLVSIAEIGGNHLLTLDEAALAACAELDGSCIAIEVTDLGFSLYCHPGRAGLRLSRQAPARDVDATISGRLMALANLAAQQDKVSTSIQERVHFHGNVALAQKLQAIVSNLDIDWEEWLAQRVGDIAAFQIHKGAREFGAWLRQSAESLLQTSSEYLREEARLSPTQVEFDQFRAGVTELRDDVARTEALLQRIRDKAASR